jgi:hypothetical protein
MMARPQSEYDILDVKPNSIKTKRSLEKIAHPHQSLVLLHLKLNLTLLPLRM